MVSPSDLAGSATSPNKLREDEKPHIPVTVTVGWDVLSGTTRQLPELDGYTIDP